MGVPMALSQALALSLDVGASFQNSMLRELAENYRDRASAVGREAQKIAIALGKRSLEFQTAGLLSRMGELAVLSILEQYSREGGMLAQNEIERALSEWAQQYGNRLKIQWRLPMAMRQMIGAVHFLPRAGVRQDLLIMRLAGLLSDEVKGETEVSRLLRMLGLEDWQRAATAAEEKGEG
jgi:HD-like signal output (HDOD) protein